MSTGFTGAMHLNTGYTSATPLNVGFTEPLFKTLATPVPPISATHLCHAKLLKSIRLRGFWR